MLLIVLSDACLWHSCATRCALTSLNTASALYTCVGLFLDELVVGHCHTEPSEDAD